MLPTYVAEMRAPLSKHSEHLTKGQVPWFDSEKCFFNFILNGDVGVRRRGQALWHKCPQRELVISA